MSVLSIYASFSDGFTSALTSAAAQNVDWKAFNSVTTNPGTLSLSNSSLGGVRWLRLVRSAADSMASVVVTGRVF